MSQENVEIVRAGFAAWNAGDMDAYRELYDPDVIVRTPEGWPEPGPYVGRDAYMRWCEQLRDTWDADALELTSDFIDAGDRVAVRQIWRTAGYGPEANVEMTNVITVRKGRVVFQEFFWDHAEALEAMGVSEMATSRTNPENVELARAYFEEIARAGREDFDPETVIPRIAEYWDPGIVWDTRGGPVEDLAGVYRGIEGASRWCREWFEAWEALHLEYELVDAGERVVTLLDLRMRGRSSGIEVALGKHAWVTTFRGGLMVRSKLYMSQSEALQAVGLSEANAPSAKAS